MAASGYDALLFDFDGVIVESVDIKTEAFAALYAEHGPAVVAQVVAHHRAHGGVSRYEKFRHYETALLGRAPLDAAREAQLGERFAALVLEAVLAAPLVAGITAVLAHYRERVPMYVVSGTPQDELEVIVAERRLGANFRALHGSPTSKRVHLQTIIAAHAYRPARVLMIGDAMTDYDAAIANDTRFVGRVAPHETNPFPEGTRVVPDFTLFEAGDLDALLDP